MSYKKSIGILFKKEIIKLIGLIQTLKSIQIVHNHELDFTAPYHTKMAQQLIKKIFPSMFRASTINVGLATPLVCIRSFVMDASLKKKDLKLFQKQIKNKSDYHHTKIINANYQNRMINLSVNKKTLAQIISLLTACKLKPTSIHAEPLIALELIPNKKKIQLLCISQGNQLRFYTCQSNQLLQCKNTIPIESCEKLKQEVNDYKNSTIDLDRLWVLSDKKQYTHIAAVLAGIPGLSILRIQKEEIAAGDLTTFYLTKMGLA